MHRQAARLPEMQEKNWKKGSAGLLYQKIII
jgi:hypothetical protein